MYLSYAKILPNEIKVRRIFFCVALPFSKGAGLLWGPQSEFWILTWFFPRHRPSTDQGKYCGNLARGNTSNPTSNPVIYLYYFYSSKSSTTIYHAKCWIILYLSTKPMTIACVWVSISLSYLLANLQDQQYQGLHENCSRCGRVPPLRLQAQHPFSG